MKLMLYFLYTHSTSHQTSDITIKRVWLMDYRLYNQICLQKLLFKKNMYSPTYTWC